MKFEIFEINKIGQRAIDALNVGIFLGSIRLY